MIYLKYSLRQFHLQENGNLFICGWDGVSIATGFHFYLKYVMKKDLDWYNTHVDLPENLELRNVTYSSTSASSIIYYQNIFTWSYSFVWWDLQRWRRHIDWMAMMGINLALAPNQEFIWEELYAMLGLSDMEIDNHFAGSAFEAWQRMGLIRGWGGPLTTAHRRLQQIQQQQIVQAQRELGMSVALPAFAGMVPLAMRRIFPEAHYTAVGNWNGFPNSSCCSLFVEPLDPLFQKLSSMFLQRIQQVYGSNHIYFCDPYNQVKPREATVEYMKYSADAIYNSMLELDQNAVWLLPSWMFTEIHYWKNDLIAAFLKAVPIGRILVLDMQSEMNPQHQRTSSFHGQPFVWCMMNNYGGTMGMYGSAPAVGPGIMNARSMRGSSMVGVGITPEEIGHNYAIFALTLEQGWSQHILNTREWFKHFGLTRYGADFGGFSQLWQLLGRSVYSYHGSRPMRGRNVITTRPSIDLLPWTWYDSWNIKEALQLILSSKKMVPPDKYGVYEHDLVDITRQFLQQSIDEIYVNLRSAYHEDDVMRYEYLTELMLQMIDEMECILASGVNFLLGTWIEDAKRSAPDQDKRRYYEFNARNQITVFGPNALAPDYAAKQWSGLVEDYYKPRWVLFHNLVIAAMKENRKFDEDSFMQRVAEEIELPFSNQTKLYLSKPVGNSWIIAKKIFDKWNELSKNSYFIHSNRFKPEQQVV